MNFKHCITICKFTVMINRKTVGFRMYRASGIISTIRTKSTYSAYNRNKLIPKPTENPYACNQRCALCGTNMGKFHYKLLHKIKSDLRG